MKNKTSFAGFMKGVFMASSVLAQEIPSLPFGIQPYEDIDMTIIDVSDTRIPNRDPDTFHVVGTTCRTGKLYVGPLMALVAEPVENVKDSVKIGARERENGASKSDPTSTDYILGTDGHFYDMRNPGYRDAYISGKLKSGQNRHSAEFKQSLRRIAETCQPKV